MFAELTSRLCDGHCGRLQPVKRVLLRLARELRNRRKTCLPKRNKSPIIIQHCALYSGCTEIEPKPESAKISHTQAVSWLRTGRKHSSQSIAEFAHGLFCGNQSVVNVLVTMREGDE